MIYEALSCITSDINEYFRSKLKINEEKVILSGIVNQDGSLSVQDKNKLLATLINVEDDFTGKTNLGNKVSRTAAHVSPSININLHVLFSAYFSGNNYAESLKFLSFLIAYFQNKTVFTKANTSNLDSRIEKLTFKIENLGIDRISHIWTMLGAKYMPSIMYKVKMLTFDDLIIREYRPEISGLSYNQK